MGQPAEGEQRTIAFRRIIHLSHTIHPQMPLWAGDPSVEFEPVADIEHDGYYLRRFSMGEHSGTHMNAPSSFFVNAVGIDAYGAESLVVPAVVMDVQDQATQDPDYSVSDRDILTWEQQHGVIPSGSVVLLYTGWQAKWVTQPHF